MEVRRYLDEQGFYEIETPMLAKSTPEGARDYLVPSRVHHGSFYALPQSPQLFKQLLMVAGLDKYFQIVRCFRDEDLRADRQPEFTQVDVEMSFPRVETIFELIEPLFERVMALIGVEVERPFPRLPYAEAIDRYGSDKPDLRFEHADHRRERRARRRSGLDTFPGLIAEGARARAIVLPAAGGVSGTRLRKINEELWLGRIVPDARGEKRNLLTLKATDDSSRSSAEKGASAEVARPLFEKAGAAKDDTVLVGVDQPGPVAMAMGILRLEMGRELKLVDEKAYRFLWVTDFPLFEWDREPSALRQPAPPVHRAGRRGPAAPRRATRRGAGQGLRHRAERQRGGRRQHPDPRLGAAGEGLQAALALRRGGARPLRLLPRGAAVRHAAPRRDRPRPRPHRDDPGRGDVAPPGDRLPQDGERAPTS